MEFLGTSSGLTGQDSIPFQNMFPDGLCRLEGGTFSKTIAFEDVNYRLAGPEDQRSIFESLCDFYNGYDPSIGVPVSYTHLDVYKRQALNSTAFRYCLMLRTLVVFSLMQSKTNSIWLLFSFKMCIRDRCSRGINPVRECCRSW